MKKLNIKKISILLSFIIFFSSTLESNFGYLNNKDYPNGYDNHFSYLIKSSNLENCYKKNSCKGLTSIENQFIKNNESKSYNHQIERFNAQIFKIYHPFYSFFIFSINKIVNDILTSRLIAHLIFLPIIGLSIFLFSKKMFGTSVACYLLCLFAFNNYHGWGYGSQINPFVLSQSFSMFAFFFLLRKSIFISTIFSLICSLTHPIGIFTNIINVIYFSVSNLKENFYKKIFIITINLILILYVYLNKSSFYNEIIIDNNSIFSREISLISLIISNVDKFFYAYQPMIKYYGLPLLLCCTSYFIIQTKNKKKIIITVSILLMAIGTLILDKPNITVTQRFMNVTAIVLLGSFFYTFNFFVKKFLENIANLKIKWSFFREDNLKKLPRLFSFITTYFSIIFIFIIFSNLLGGLKLFYEYNKYFSENHDVSFSKKQIDNIKGENIIIFDTFEKADYFYLLYGMQKNNHLYYNKLDFEKNILNNNIPKYFVKMSKLYEKNNDSDIFIYKDERVIFNNQLEKDFIVTIEAYKNSQIILNDKTINIKKNFLSSKKKISLQLRSGTNIISVNKGKIKIVSYNNNQNFNWPWNKNANLEINKMNKNYKISFDDNLNSFENCDTQIINDEGSSHLYKLNNCKF